MSFSYGIVREMTDGIKSTLELRDLVATVLKKGWQARHVRRSLASSGYCRLFLVHRVRLSRSSSYISLQISADKNKRS